MTAGIATSSMLAFEVLVDMTDDHGKQITDVHPQKVLLDISGGPFTEREYRINQSPIAMRQSRFDHSDSVEFPARPTHYDFRVQLVQRLVTGGKIIERAQLIGIASVIGILTEFTE